MAIADKSTPISPDGVTPPQDTIPVTNPVTGAVIGEIEKTSREQVEATVKRAHTAQRIWRQMSVAERCNLLRKFEALLWQHQRQAMDTIRSETGKNDTSAFFEVIILCNLVSWCYHHAPRLLAPQRRRATFPIIQYAKVYYKPHGVVGFISPWNYPMMLSYVDAIPALAAGNAVIIKPSEITPYSALYIRDLMVQVGIPKDVVQVITGDGETGAALTELVDYISFTGSTAAGKKVAVKAAERLIPYSLELGGKNPMIVLRDADLDIAATNALTGALENAGQMCISIERVYVESEVYDEFVEKIKHYAGQLTLSAANGFEVHMGSLTNLREMERAERHVEDALAKGATLVSGGKRRPDLGPLFYEPAILANVDHSMEVMNEETFGPVIPVMRVKNEAEAVVLANSSEYGLSGAVYTRNLALGEHLATQLETGDVSVNRMTTVPGAHDLPWGGRKQSGVGRRGGREGLMRFVSPQTVQVERFAATPPTVSAMEPSVHSVLKLIHWLRRVLPFV